MQLKKFFASLFAVLLVFSCFLPLSSRAYADDVVFQLFCPVPPSGSGSYDSIAVGYTPSYDLPHIYWGTSFLANQTMPTITFSSSIYDNQLVGGSTLYLGWFLLYKNGSVGVSTANISVESSTQVVAQPTSFSSISHTLLATSAVTSYSKSGFSTTGTTCIRFSIPTNSHAWRMYFSAYRNASSVDASIDSIYFPVLYLSGWGSDIADSLDSILAELLDQGRSLDSILAVLNSIYTEATKISSDTDAIRSLMVTCANKLTSADSHLANIENTVDDIYYLLYEALSEESDDLSDDAADLGDSISQRIDSEQYWNDKNTSTYNAIGLDNFSFSNGILSGLQLVGTVFSNLWNALGDATIPIIFALTLGVALVVIGRIGRSSGGHSSKKDDK